MSGDEATDPAVLLTRTKRSHAGHRASATRLTTRATTALREEEVDKDDLSLIKQLLLEKVSTLKRLDEQIAGLVPDAELEDEIQNADETLEKIYGIMAKLSKALGPFVATPLDTVARVEPRSPTTSPDRAPPAVVHRSPPAAPSLVGSTASHMDRVKLPKITLPRFRGDLMKWTAFWDSFDSAVHRNDRLSEIDKFNYLRSLLEGTAFDAVAGLALSAVNYVEAMRILQKRFGNKQLIISKHMKTLLAVNAVTADHHLRDLRRQATI